MAHDLLRSFMTAFAVLALLLIPSSVDASSQDQGSRACPFAGDRKVDVASVAELEAALADAQPGDRIQLADVTYEGTFVAEHDGTIEQHIWLCGTRNAIIDGGDFEDGYALHLTADYWIIQGITITNALKGVMLDGANRNVLDSIAVHAIGHEGVHFRTHSSDNIITNSEIYDTGLKKEKFGEGVYIGSAVSNWERYTDGKPDESDRNMVLRNHIWNTTAENIDIKEGTSNGIIDGNILDGSKLTGADSWIDVKGNFYVVIGNTGTNSPEDGFQTHVINNLDWGRHNSFDRNIAEVNGDGFGFYIHDPETSGNTVFCNNEVTAAGKGFANVECSGQ
jgi:Right handed beta helix region